MGGRGSVSGTPKNSRKYGTEYETVLELDNIKIVRRILGAPVLPQETMSSAKGRVYIVGNRNGGIKSIGLYAKVGRLRRQVDLDHKHRGQQPHVHEGHEHSQRPVKLTKSDLAYIRKAKRLWELM